tara:strand:- start:427 stop:885 length:459 start_codon:yes stop_codon:yes gene_type:complete
MTRLLKASNEIILVFLQLLIIILHFIKFEFLTNLEIIQVSSVFRYLGNLIIMISSFVMLISIKELGNNLSPLPKPIKNGNLITSGIYALMRHPMYYSLISISFGVFITKLSFYYLSLTICLVLVIKYKIILEEKHLNTKFKNYLLYKQKVKY